MMWSTTDWLTLILAFNDVTSFIPAGEGSFIDTVELQHTLFSPNIEILYL